MSAIVYSRGVSPREQVYMMYIFTEHVRQELTQAALDSIRPSVQKTVDEVMKEITPTLREKLAELNNNLVESIITDYEKGA